MVILAILSVYALSYVAVYKNDPFGIIERIRERITTLSCVACTSFWLALPFGLQFSNWFLCWLGIWGAVIIIDHIVQYFMVK